MEQENSDSHHICLKNINIKGQNIENDVNSEALKQKICYKDKTNGQQQKQKPGQSKQQKQNQQYQSEYLFKPFQSILNNKLNRQQENNNQQNQHRNYNQIGSKISTIADLPQNKNQIQNRQRYKQQNRVRNNQSKQDQPILKKTQSCQHFSSQINLDGNSDEKSNPSNFSKLTVQEELKKQCYSVLKNQLFIKNKKIQELKQRLDKLQRQKAVLKQTLATSNCQLMQKSGEVGKFQYQLNFVSQNAKSLECSLEKYKLMYQQIKKQYQSFRKQSIQLYRVQCLKCVKKCDHNYQDICQCSQRIINKVSTRKMNQCNQCKHFLSNQNQKVQKKTGSKYSNNEQKQQDTTSLLNRNRTNKNMALPLQTYKNFSGNKNQSAKEMGTTMVDQNPSNYNESEIVNINDKVKGMLNNLQKQNSELKKTLQLYQGKIEYYCNNLRELQGSLKQKQSPMQNLSAHQTSNHQFKNNMSKQQLDYNVEKQQFRPLRDYKNFKSENSENSSLKFDLQYSNKLQLSRCHSPEKLRSKEDELQQGKVNELKQMYFQTVQKLRNASKQNDILTDRVKSKDNQVNTLFSQLTAAGNAINQLRNNSNRFQTSNTENWQKNNIQSAKQSKEAQPNKSKSQQKCSSPPLPPPKYQNEIINKEILNFGVQNAFVKPAQSIQVDPSVFLNMLSLNQKQNQYDHQRYVRTQEDNQTNQKNNIQYKFKQQNIKNEDQKGQNYILMNPPINPLGLLKNTQDQSETNQRNLRSKSHQNNNKPKKKVQFEQQVQQNDQHRNVYSRVPIFPKLIEKIVLNKARPTKKQPQTYQSNKRCRTETYDRNSQDEEVDANIYTKNIFDFVTQKNQERKQKQKILKDSRISHTGTVATIRNNEKLIKPVGNQPQNAKTFSQYIQTRKNSQYISPPDVSAYGINQKNSQNAVNFIRNVSHVSPSYIKNPGTYHYSPQAIYQAIPMNRPFAHAPQNVSIMKQQDSSILQARKNAYSPKIRADILTPQKSRTKMIVNPKTQPLPFALQQRINSQSQANEYQRVRNASSEYPQPLRQTPRFPANGRMNPPQKIFLRSPETQLRSNSPQNRGFPTFYHQNSTGLSNYAKIPQFRHLQVQNKSLLKGPSKNENNPESHHDLIQKSNCNNCFEGLGMGSCCKSKNQSSQAYQLKMNFTDSFKKRYQDTQTQYNNMSEKSKAVTQTCESNDSGILIFQKNQCSCICTDCPKKRNRNMSCENKNKK